MCAALLQLLPGGRPRSAHLADLEASFPFMAQPAKVGPVFLFALREPLDQFEVDLGAVPNAGEAWLARCA